MRTVTCFGDRTSGTFLNCLGLSDEDNSFTWPDNFVNVNDFNSVTSPSLVYSLTFAFRTISYVSFNVKLTFGLKPQVGGIKIVSV